MLNQPLLLIERVLGALGLNLELKARVYEAASLSALFLLNNYHYILKALQRFVLCSSAVPSNVN